MWYYVFLIFYFFKKEIFILKGIFSISVRSGMDGYGFSSWIRDQLVLQWKRESNRENNREGNREKENVNWEHSSYSSFCTTFPFIPLTNALPSKPVSSNTPTNHYPN